MLGNSLHCLILVLTMHNHVEKQATQSATTEISANRTMTQSKQDKSTQTTFPLKSTVADSSQYFGVGRGLYSTVLTTVQGEAGVTRAEHGRTVSMTERGSLPGAMTNHDTDCSNKGTVK